MKLVSRDVDGVGLEHDKLGHRNVRYYSYREWYLSRDTVIVIGVNMVESPGDDPLGLQGQVADRLEAHQVGKVCSVSSGRGIEDS